jgi:hypothetical protein
MALTYSKRLTSTKREAVFELARVDGGFPICPDCGLPVFHTQRWDPDIPDDEPNAAPRGVVHMDCKHRRSTHQASRPRSRHERRARQRHIGALRSDYPLPGGRDSPLRKKLNGEVVARDFRRASSPLARAWGDELDATLDTVLAAVAAEMARRQ